MVQHYELLYILNGDKTEEEAKAMTEQMKQLVIQRGGTIAKQDFWGKRKLAYEIDKIRQGFYDLIALDIETEKLADLDQAFRLHEDIVRHQITIRIVKTPEQLAAEEQLRERIAAKRAAVKDKETVAAVAEHTPTQVQPISTVPVSGEELEEKLGEILEEDKIDV